MTDDDTSPTMPPLVDGRYRVDQLLGRACATTTWLGWDERLLRPVRLHVPAEPGRLPDALATARVAHPTLLAAVDVCREPIVLITEHVAGHPLAARLGPWRWPEAAHVMDAVGDAVATLHEAGLAHGSLSPGSIELGPDGRIVLGDCFARRDPGGSLAGTDVTALSMVLAALVTGHDGAPADTIDALEHLQPPPPDELVELVTSGMGAGGLERAAGEASAAPSDAGEWLRQLRALPDWSAGEAFGPEHVGPAGFVRRERVWFIPALVLVAVGLALALAGLAGGNTPVGRRIIEGARDAVGLPVQPATTAAPGPNPPGTVPGAVDGVTPLPIAAVVDFDPEGDGVEHPDRLTEINDDDPVQGWYTERYTTHDFGGLKSGVGLIIRLHEPGPLARVVVDTPNRGWSAEVRTSNAGLPDTLEDWGPASGGVTEASGQAEIELDGSVASSLLVWITDLGEDTGDGFRLTVTAITAVGTETP